MEKNEEQANVKAFKWEHFPQFGNSKEACRDQSVWSSERREGKCRTSSKKEKKAKTYRLLQMLERT